MEEGERGSEEDQLSVVFFPFGRRKKSKTAVEQSDFRHGGSSKWGFRTAAFLLCQVCPPHTARGF